ncbi:hypothetical protein [Kitasatospora kazusensis]
MMSTPADFVKGLGLLRVEAGRPPLRELSRSTGIPRSTLSVIFDPRRGQLPTLERCFALLAALGVTEPQTAQWAAAWRRIQGAELRQAETPAAEPDAEPGPAADAVTATGPAPDAETDAVTNAETGPVTGPAEGRGAAVADGASKRGGERRRLGVAFSLGFVLAVASTLATLHLIRASAPPAPVLVGDYAVCRPAGLPSGPQTARPGPPPATAGSVPAHPAAWVGRPAYDAQILTTTQVALPITTAVADGHTLIITMMLTSTCPGPVTVTDSQDNHYRTVSDVTDASRHRVLIIAAFDVDGLGTADSVKLGYPKASKYQVAVDEFSGLSGADQAVTASGAAGGTAFTTGTVPLSCTGGGLQVAAIGTNSGDAPAPSADWTVVPPVLKLSSYRLTTAYRLTRTTGPCAVTGTTTAQWAAALATFH